MRRKRSSRNRGHDSNSIWATLEIQYKASRASVLERTARRDELTQERVQTRSTFEDLKALKIIWDDVCPTGYEIGWGLAVVRVRWRLEKGCYEHLRLQYQTRAAHEKMRDTMREREIASLAWNEDGRRIHMDMLPTRPVIAPMVVEKVNADIPLSINTSQNIPVNQRETVTILPPLSFSLSGNSVSMSYVEANRATEPCPRRDSTPEEHPIRQATEPTTPQKGGSNENLGFTFTRAEIAALRESPSKPASYRRLGRVNTGPDACAMSLDQTESPNTSSASSPSPYDSHHKAYGYCRGASEDSTAVMETSPVDSSFIFDGRLWRQPSSDPDPSSSYDQERINSEPPSPTTYCRSDEELLRHLLVEEMARRRQLEDIVDAQKQYSDDVIASHASEVREVDGILANAQKMQATLLAQLAESQSDVLQLQAALNACKDKLVALQGELVAEQRRRVRVTAMLENVRSQYDTPAVPVVADALSFVDELTSQALLPTS